MTVAVQDVWLFGGYSRSYIIKPVKLLVPLQSSEVPDEKERVWDEREGGDMIEETRD